MGMAKRLFKRSFSARKWMARGLGFFIAAYGLYAFFKREIGSYMILKNQFVYFDLDEPLARFLLDYIAVMGLFLFIGHYLSEGIKKCEQQNSGKRSRK